MQALKLAELSGPEGLQLVDQPDPEPTHFMTPGEGVVIDVRAAAVSFPDVLQTRGLYQFKPPLPFVPGAEVAGVVADASPDTGLKAGDRVAAMTMIGGMAERAAAPAPLTFKLPDQLEFVIRDGADRFIFADASLIPVLSKLEGKLDTLEQIVVLTDAGEDVG